MTLGKGVLEKSDRITWRSEWTSHLEKFSKKSWWAFSSRNWTWNGGTGRLEDKEGLEWKGFWVRLDLRLGARRSLSKRERKRQNTVTIEQIERKEMVWMHEICMNMWRAKNKLHHELKSNPNTLAHNFQQSSTHLNAWNIVKMIMECNAWPIIYH